MARERHRPVVGRDDEQHAVDAADAGEHRAYEFLMSGNVDKSDLQVVAHQMREAQINRYAPLVLFVPAVAVDPGDRLDELRLAVIDVAGCTDDDATHVWSGSRARLEARAFCRQSPAMASRSAVASASVRR